MTIEPKQFDYIKRTLAAGVVETMMERRGWSEDEALRRFFDSEVYDCLQDEESHTWHFSPYQLADSFEDELEGREIWPGM